MGIEGSIGAEESIGGGETSHGALGGAGGGWGWRGSMGADEGALGRSRTSNVQQVCDLLLLSMV